MSLFCVITSSLFSLKFSGSSSTLMKSCVGLDVMQWISEMFFKCVKRRAAVRQRNGNTTLLRECNDIHYFSRSITIHFPNQRISVFRVLSTTFDDSFFVHKSYIICSWLRVGKFPIQSCYRCSKAFKWNISIYLRWVQDLQLIQACP